VNFPSLRGLVTFVHFSANIPPLPDEMPFSGWCKLPLQATDNKKGLPLFGNKPSLFAWLSCGTDPAPLTLFTYPGIYFIFIPAVTPPDFKRHWKAVFLVF
jgi:hypothetical protein